MNEQERNDVIASHENDGLDEYLDNREEPELSDPCERCEKNETWIEFNNIRICQDCYEDGCEQAERMAEDR